MNCQSIPFKLAILFFILFCYSSVCTYLSRLPWTPLMKPALLSCSSHYYTHGYLCRLDAWRWFKQHSFEFQLLSVTRSLCEPTPNFHGFIHTPWCIPRSLLNSEVDLFMNSNGRYHYVLYKSALCNFHQWVFLYFLALRPFSHLIPHADFALSSQNFPSSSLLRSSSSSSSSLQPTCENIYLSSSSLMYYPWRQSKLFSYLLLAPS